MSSTRRERGPLDIPRGIHDVKIQGVDHFMLSQELLSLAQHLFMTQRRAASPASFHGSSWPPPVSGGSARPHGKGGPGSHVLGSCSSQR